MWSLIAKIAFGVIAEELFKQSIPKHIRRNGAYESGGIVEHEDGSIETHFALTSWNGQLDREKHSPLYRRNKERLEIQVIDGQCKEVIVSDQQGDYVDGP
jgi:hypothetical protein